MHRSPFCVAALKRGSWVDVPRLNQHRWPPRLTGDSAPRVVPVILWWMATALSTKVGGCSYAIPAPAIVNPGREDRGRAT